MRVGFAICLSLALLGCSDKRDARTSELQRELEGYAVASCLFLQPDTYLSSQGDGWASVIVQSTTADLEKLLQVQEEVKAAMKMLPMVVTRVEREGGATTLALPLLYCHNVASAESVRATIERILRSATGGSG